MAMDVHHPLLYEHPLHSPRLKLARARQHLNRLDELVSAFARDFQAHPPGVTLKDQPDDDGYPWTYVLLDSPTEPPADWGLLVGDAIHNIRSALDNLVAQLIFADGGVATFDRKSRHGFPIYEHPNDGRMRLALEKLSETNRAAIKALQPYEHPGTSESNRMLALALLDNFDKHSMVPTVIAMTWAEAITLTSGSTSVPIPGPGQPVPLKNGAPLLRLFRPNNEDVKVQGLGLSISFAAPGLSVDYLRQIRDHVVGIVESFVGAWTIIENPSYTHRPTTGAPTSPPSIFRSAAISATGRSPDTKCRSAVTPPSNMGGSK